MDMSDADHLIAQVLKELAPVHTDCEMAGLFPDGVVVVSRACRMLSSDV